MANRWIKSYDIDPDHPVVGIRTGMTAYWEDLIKMAAGVDGYQGLERGQLRASRSLLADRWRQLTDKQIRGFLDRLRLAGMIKIEPHRGAKGTSAKGQGTGQGKGQPLSLYTIVNYAKYQGGLDEEAYETASDGAKIASEKGQPIKRKNLVKEIERKEEDTAAAAPPTSPVLEQIDLEDAIRSNEKSDLDKVIDRWNEVVGFQKVLVLNPERKSSLRARIKEAGGVDGVLTAIEHLSKQPFYTGREKSRRDGKPFHLKFETFVRPSKFISYFEEAQAEKAKTASRQVRVIRPEDLGT